MFNIPDLCPVCHKPLEVSKTKLYCCTIKVCPDGHYVEEVHPLLDSVIVFQKKD